MTEVRRVALLRGINVGGANRLAMADLRATAESIDRHDVVTDIQSGNLAFTPAADADDTALARSLRSTPTGSPPIDPG